MGFEPKLVETSKWVDFKAVKEVADVDDVLRELGLIPSPLLRHKDDEIIGACPFHEEKEDRKNGKAPFAINMKKKNYHCFACKRKGSILDFVKEYLTHVNKDGIESSLQAAADYIMSAMRTQKAKRGQEEWLLDAELERKKEREQEWVDNLLSPSEPPQPTMNGVAEKRPSELTVPAFLNPSVFVSFAAACREVATGRAHAREFVAVRVSELEKIFLKK